MFLYKFEDLNLIAMNEIHNPYEGQEGYNCFGCSPGNLSGLRLRFFEDGDEIVCSWDPEDKFQGWKNVLHGGIQATLMDEIASWLIFVKLGTAGVTYRLNARYRKPVFIDRGNVMLRAVLKETRRNISEIEVTLFDGSGQLCSEGSVEYFLFPEEQARRDMQYPGREAFVK